MPYMAFYHDEDATTPYLPEPAELMVPYQVGQHTRVDTSWLWIIHLRLRTLRGPGSVTRVVHEALKACFVDDEEAFLVYHEIEFDLNSDADGEAHRKEIMRVLGPLAELSNARVMVFVYTHSHETTGVPFFGANLAAYDMRNWFDILIPEDVRPWLRMHDTTLFMLCCGSIIASAPAYAQLKAHCESLQVTRLLAFQAGAFQAALATSFFIGYMLRFVLEGVTFSEVQLGNVLAQSHDLGRHSRVIVMSPDGDGGAVTVAEYFWTSPTIRPYGTNIPPQCPACHALSTFKISHDSANKTTSTRCQEPGCTYSSTYEPPQENVKVLNHQQKRDLHAALYRALRGRQRAYAEERKAAEPNMHGREDFEGASTSVSATGQCHFWLLIAQLSPVEPSSTQALRNLVCKSAHARVH
ncbi:hypothetical protein OH77DRAFT_1512802 [Trametes cingulata]|nr:hypothetical protein OH77DRAFT_1512802 [Trametes cingulata]